MYPLYPLSPTMAHTIEGPFERARRVGLNYYTPLSTLHMPHSQSSTRFVPSHVFGGSTGLVGSPIRYGTGIGGLHDSQRPSLQGGVSGAGKSSRALSSGSSKSNRRIQQGSNQGSSARNSPSRRSGSARPGSSKDNRGGSSRGSIRKAPSKKSNRSDSLKASKKMSSVNRQKSKNYDSDGDRTRGLKRGKIKAPSKVHHNPNEMVTTEYGPDWNKYEMKIEDLNRDSFDYRTISKNFPIRKTSGLMSSDTERSKFDESKDDASSAYTPQPILKEKRAKRKNPKILDAELILGLICLLLRILGFLVLISYFKEIFLKYILPVPKFYAESLCQKWKFW